MTTAMDLMLATAELSMALGVKDLAHRSEPWVHRIDERWTVAAQAHAPVVPVEPEGCMAVDLERFHIAFWWNGWLAGIISAAGGEVAAHPDGANVDRLLADIAAATRRASN